MRGYKPGRFSFNVKGGRCEACEGDGQIKIEMHFLPDIYVTCDVCGGAPLQPRDARGALQGPQHRRGPGHDGGARRASSSRTCRRSRRVLETLDDVGLGYIHLGQPATTLSGGEAQRVKLAASCRKRATGRTLYILDEPTTGLHFEDVGRLLELLHRLVDKGNTVVVIEHNLDVIKTADWIIDLGPEGGEAGGELVAEGTPEAGRPQQERATPAATWDRRSNGPAADRPGYRPASRASRTSRSMILSFSARRLSYSLRPRARAISTLIRLPLR